MLADHDIYPSPSVTGRGSHLGIGRVDFIKCHTKNNYRWNIWSRWSQQRNTQTSKYNIKADCIRQRSASDCRSKDDYRSTFSNYSRELCFDERARSARNGRCHLDGLGNQLSSNRRSRSWIFFSPRRSFGHEDGYNARSECGGVVSNSRTKRNSEGH